MTDAVSQPLCETCANFDGGACPLLLNIQAGQGADAVVTGCTSHEPIVQDESAS